MIPHGPDSSSSDRLILGDPISFARTVELGGHPQATFAFLVSRGEIWSVKLGRNWVTTTKAVEEYLACHRRPWWWCFSSAT